LSKNILPRRRHAAAGIRTVAKRAKTMATRLDAQLERKRKAAARQRAWRANLTPDEVERRRVARQSNRNVDGERVARQRRRQSLSPTALRVLLELDRKRHAKLRERAAHTAVFVASSSPLVVAPVVIFVPESSPLVAPAAAISTSAFTHAPLSLSLPSARRRLRL